jgi:glutaredoxin 3
VKEFLSDHGIVFTDHNVAEDPKALAALLATTSRRATPVVVVGDEIVVGFDRGRLQRRLRLSDGEHSDDRHLSRLWGKA